jgi:fluoride ion exporter CrcB/FEX
MLNSGKMVRAITYATVNNVGGVAAAFAGFNMAKRIIKN